MLCTDHGHWFTTCTMVIAQANYEENNIHVLYANPNSVFGEWICPIAQLSSCPRVVCLSEVLPCELGVYTTVMAQGSLVVGRQRTVKH